MPGVDPFLYNPLAQSFLQATEDFDIGTPDGYLDTWDVQTIDIALAPGEIRLNKDFFFFSTDFLVYACWQNTITSGFAPWNARWIDIDGRPMSNTRIKDVLFAGTSAQFPQPFLHPWYIPRNKYFSIDVENETAAFTSVQFQLNLVGVRRTRVS